jgi:hypothetical protein
MKSISSALDAHLKLEVTTLCTCWRIERTDGKVFGFTDLDRDITFNGIPYESQSSYNRTAITGDESLSVDNLNVTGFLDSETISENDLRNGLFDFAKVFVFGLNWSDLTQGEIKLRRGWFGEVIVNENGSFETEIRGLHQALTYSVIETYQPECRADFCDARCKLKIADFTHQGTVFSATSRQVFKASSLPVVATTGSTTVGAHRYWRIKPTGTFYTTYVGFAEVKFFDQSNGEITGGNTTSNSDRAGSAIDIPGIIGTDYHSGRARDGNINSSWQCKKDETTTAYWQIDFGSNKDVKSVIMRTPANDFHIAPLSFDLLYSDNGLDFFVAAPFSAEWTGNGQEETWTIGTPTSDPVDFPTTQGAVPPPFTGASTYVGGTVTFNTGPNTGKTIEVIDYNPANYEVTMFESFPYPISKSDKFTITQGCNKAFSTCKIYNNGNNFRGEPHVPGQDEFLSYPDATNG